MSSFLRNPVDYTRHNDEVRSVMEAYGQGNPVRVPLMVYGSITNYFFNRDLNSQGLTFEQFFNDPEVQIRAQLEYQHWTRHNLVCDRMMGNPQDGWQLGLDFQNSYDASWMGAPMRYEGLFLPDTDPLLDQHKEKLYDLPEMLPFDGGLIGRGLEFYDYMVEYCGNHEFQGLPIHPPRNFVGEGTDGVLDLAYKVRGAANLLVDLYEDENYFHDLMSYITRNLIHRMKQLRELRWERMPNSPDVGKYHNSGFSMADDAMALISTATYVEHVLPYHRQLLEAFGDGAGMGFHLCGDAMRHFPTLVKELGVRTLDTGFPVDFGLLRKQVGPDVTINGGPTVMLLKDGSSEQIHAEVRRILHTGVTAGGKFVMIAANNMAPLTPVENVAILYDAVKAYGNYPIIG